MPTIRIAAFLLKLKRSFITSAGTIVFGMEDGTVSIFGLIFGVAATTTDNAAVVIAGASGAVELALWMLVADFFSAAVPILPFMFWNIPVARLIAALATVCVLVGLSIGRAYLGRRSPD
jgi:VIT1/CCC1 family predicted Fe2+/Mn2+ transporter